MTGTEGGGGALSGRNGGGGGGGGETGEIRRSGHVQQGINTFIRSGTEDVGQDVIIYCPPLPSSSPPSPLLITCLGPINE